jgi:glycolate oxidase FAD binding subunit
MGPALSPQPALLARDDFCGALREAGERGAAVRFAGGGTRRWGSPGREPAVELSTAGLDRVVEHNSGDLTAVLEAGVRLQKAQAAFAEAGQMLALDPPDRDAATVGGLVATADSGPLRSRYGGVRDLVVGITVALSDGTVATAGGKVIKNVAGYDLAKLFAGSFGTLGAVLEVCVRLHPLPPATATAAAGSTDPVELGRLAHELAHAPLEHVGLDLRFGGGDGAVLVRFGGAACREQAEPALCRRHGGARLGRADRAAGGDGRRGQARGEAGGARAARALLAAPRGPLGG